MMQSSATTRRARALRRRGGVRGALLVLEALLDGLEHG